METVEVTTMEGETYRFTAKKVRFIKECRFCGTEIRALSPRRTYCNYPHKQAEARNRRIIRELRKNTPTVNTS